jgi:cyclopropane-fatty-acyl-phospholipid synthase
MAEKTDLDFTYSEIDEIFRLSIGEMGDFSGAKYDGDFSTSLEEAQTKKHQFIADSLGIKKGSKVLDMGCGWGSFLSYSELQGAKPIGLTLSEGQYNACHKNGMNVYIKDCRKVDPADFGTFDALVSVGAFEHFCSVQDFKEGKQERVYTDFFREANDLLQQGSRFYLQTMVFGKNMIDLEAADINAHKNSTAYIIALMMKQFPGSWLPYGSEMVEKMAEPWFKLISKSSGRLDYIETISQWRKRFREFNFKKYLIYLSMLPKLFSDEEFRHRVAIFRISPNRVCFEREVMDHYRFVFEKK